MSEVSENPCERENETLQIFCEISGSEWAPEVCKISGSEWAPEICEISVIDRAAEILPKCERPWRCAAATQVLPQKCQQIWHATARIVVQNLRGCAPRPWRMPKLVGAQSRAGRANRQDSGRWFGRSAIGSRLGRLWGSSGDFAGSLGDSGGLRRRFWQHNGELG